VCAWARARSLADRRWVVVLGLALFAAVLTLPLWLNGYLTGHDRHFHLKWARFFTEQFRGGELYPRWLTGMNDGQGSPAFFFYGPLEYWITAILPPWSIDSFEDTARQLGLAAWLAVFASGTAFFAWIRRHVGNLAALLGAVAYLVLPYQVVVDVYARFAFAELWSFAWIPFVLLFADRIVRGERYGIHGLAVSYALLLMTHVPSALIFSAIPGLYVLVQSPARRRGHALASVLAGHVLGAALAAVYLVPALTMQHLVAMREVLWSDYFEARNNFLFFGPRFEGGARDAAFWLWLTRLALLTVGVGAVAVRLAWSPENRRILLFWWGALLLALFMTHPFSRPIWDLASVVRAVQFPWRFMVVQTLAAAVLCAFAARAVLERGSPARLAAVAVAALALAVPWAAKAQEIAGHVRHPYHPTPAVMVHLHETGEYRPALVSRDVWASLRQPSVDAGPMEFAAVGKGDGRAEILSRTPREIRLRVSAARETDLVVRQFAFATWRATLDGHAAEVLTTPESRIRVHVPAGSHEVRLELASHPNERIGGWISGVALAGLLAVPLVRETKRRAQKSYSSGRW
jgi:hypothetical protein